MERNEGGVFSEMYENLVGKSKHVENAISDLKLLDLLHVAGRNPPCQNTENDVIFFEGSYASLNFNHFQ